MEHKTGITLQLTKITTGAETTAAPPAFGGGGQRGGGGQQGFGGGGQRAAGGATGVVGGSQEQWLQQQQLELMQILKERKQKRDQRTAFYEATGT
jgi:hypothetical protein